MFKNISDIGTTHRYLIYHQIFARSVSGYISDDPIFVVSASKFENLKLVIVALSPLLLT